MHREKAVVKDTTLCGFKLDADSGLPLVVFDTFDLRQAVDAKHGKAPQPANHQPTHTTEWLDEEPRLAVDKNGIPLVLHIPGWQKEKALVSCITPC